MNVLSVQGPIKPHTILVLFFLPQIDTLSKIQVNEFSGFRISYALYNRRTLRGGIMTYRL